MKRKLILGLLGLIALSLPTITDAMVDGQPEGEAARVAKPGGVVFRMGEYEGVTVWHLVKGSRK